MTPAARWAAAAQIMDEITAGSAAEKALTNWARRSRFAGSKDRAAIRDHVFDILRCWRSTAALGGGTSGRHLVLGRLRQIGQDPETVFTGEGHALAPLSATERTAGSAPSGAVAADIPDWIFERLSNDLGVAADAFCEALRTRAAVFVRVNTAKTDRDGALRALAEDGIAAAPHPLSETALELGDGARRIGQSAAYRTGLVELQDAASQAVVDALPLAHGQSVLDYCAGGGGKTLAMAARLRGVVDAHDSNRARLRDLPDRAARAAAEVRIVDRLRGTYDLVLCDVPCSGSGAWRRTPEAKWRLTPAMLAEVQAAQRQILDAVVPGVSAKGVLAYATCSVFRSENEDQVAAFLERTPGWMVRSQQRFGPHQGGDGFFLAILARVSEMDTTKG